MRHYIRHVLPKIDRLSDHQQSSDLLTSEESPYRPTARPPSSDDAESTYSIPNFLGSEDDEVSDSEEVLSADDDSGEEDEVLDASAEPTSPSQAHDQHQTTDSLGSAVSTSTLSLHPENRKTGLSLRCRLPPAMDLKAIQDLILSPSRRERSWETEAPSGLRPTPSTSGVSSHVRRQSFHQSAIRPHKFTASNVALLTPMVRAHDHGGPSTVTADLQAIFHDLITTPSELRTTVYTQGDDDDDEDDDDQNGHDVSPNQQHLRTYNFSDLNRQLHHQQTISSTNTSIPIHSPTSSLPVHNHSKLPSDDHYIPPTPDFAFQTPGYGFF
ncbi:hypothetical protein KEM48_003841 [Puccinia striiformis f. sp. tritici PST-130]|nr:hypothetical protein KEM48_003841 [Puccinia striiformis f. sp. tritici PST-130]